MNKLFSQASGNQTDVTQQLVREQIKELVQAPSPKKNCSRQLKNYQDFVQCLFFGDDDDFECIEEL